MAKQLIGYLARNVVHFFLVNVCLWMLLIQPGGFTKRANVGLFFLAVWLSATVNSDTCTVWTCAVSQDVSTSPARLCSSLWPWQPQNIAASCKFKKSNHHLLRHQQQIARAVATLPLLAVVLTSKTTRRHILLDLQKDERKSSLKLSQGGVLQ